MRNKLIIIFSIFIFLLWVLIPVLFLVFASLMSDASLNDGIISLSYALKNTLTLLEIENRIISISENKFLLSLTIRSFILSLLVAITVSWLSWVIGFYTTRKVDYLASSCLPISLFTYLTPPIVLVIGLSSMWNNHSTSFVWLKILFCHCVYLFPIAFTLSVGFWVQKPYEIDRMAAIDGAAFWDRLILHVGVKEFLYMSIIGILVFMISWSDIIFSRVLASSDVGQRLLVDYIFQRLFSNSVIDAYGELSLFSLFIILVSALISTLFGMVFFHAIIENK